MKVYVSCNATGLLLTNDFWDCECDVDYIHPRAEKDCKKCGMEEESADAPDSHALEVIEAGLATKEQIIADEAYL